MAGPFIRITRQLSAQFAAPMLVIAIAVPTRPDPAKRIGGTAGIIVIPTMSAPAPSATPRGEAVPLEGRRDARAARGRVLYAAGHAPRDTTAARPAHKPCPVERVVQTRDGNSAPIS